jgi:capsular polysaccharide biosynthesis protein
MIKYTLNIELLSLRKNPSNLKKDHQYIFESELKKVIPTNYVLKLKNAIILEDTLLHNWLFLNKHTHTFKIDWLYKLKLLAKRFILPSLTVNNAIWITDDLSEGYFHWILDCLPRLLNIIKTSEITSDYVIILTPGIYNQTFVKESLDLLGFKYFVKESKKVNIKCRQLLLANHCASTTGNYNDGLIKELRDFFLKKIEIKKSATKKWIYISRANATRRKANNEEELVTMLLANNVEVHYFEEYNFLKQMEVIAHTDYLISIHGASLTNMLFMSDNSHVIELRNSQDKHSNCYFSLASALNINYHYLLNEGEDVIPHFSNLSIDVASLKNYILKLKGV